VSRNIQKSLGRLYGLLSRGRQYGLERMQAACAEYGNPERSFKAIHVAGTNGKGSVCAFTASMLQARGTRVGLFTSPHLNRFAERIQIDGESVSDDVLCRWIDDVMDRDLDLSFFETATLIAFLVFREAKIDTAVLEVGLGGRLDATNVIPSPIIAAITRVSFDHMDVLGDTLSAIAREKAAVIKSGCKVVIGKLHPDAMREVEQRCAEVGAELLPLGDAEPYQGAQLAYPRIAMYGSNLAVSTTIARTLGIPPEAMATGVENAVWPGRNELLHRSGQELTLLDCAHNPDAAVCLSHVIDSSLAGGAGTRADVALVFGAMETKNWKSMLDRLEHSAAHRFYVAPPVDRAVDPAEMVKYQPGQIFTDVGRAIESARARVGQHGLVVVTGSCFLVGAARAILLNLETDPPADA
jgi:dihydrofolate synthase / folylpolyglutamate synthase